MGAGAEETALVSTSLGEMLMLGRGTDAGTGEEGAHPGKGTSDKVAGAKVCGHRWGVERLEPGAGRGEDGIGEWTGYSY